MGKIRIYELARNLNMTNKQLLEKLEALGMPAKSHMSSVDETEVDSIRTILNSRSDTLPVTSRREKFGSVFGLSRCRHP